MNKLTIISLALLLSACEIPATTESTSVPEARSAQPGEPETQIEQPLEWGVGNPVLMAWLDGEHETGQFNVFSHLPVNAFCTPFEFSEALVQTGYKRIASPMTAAQYNAKVEDVKDFLYTQNMIENTDYEIVYSPGGTLQGMKITLLNHDLNYGYENNAQRFDGVCQTTLLVD